MRDGRPSTNNATTAFVGVSSCSDGSSFQGLPLRTSSMKSEMQIRKTKALSVLAAHQNRRGSYSAMIRRTERASHSTIKIVSAVSQVTTVSVKPIARSATKGLTSQKIKRLPLKRNSANLGIIIG